MELLRKNLLYIAWIAVLIGMVGSLYFQYILHFQPCVLCWYQRTAMYPLVIIIGVGILKKDSGFLWSALPLAIIGLLTAIYQNLLYYNILPESAAPCALGVSCTTRYIDLFGFLDVPQLSLLGFVFVIVILLIYRSTIKKEINNINQ